MQFTANGGKATDFDSGLRTGVNQGCFERARLNLGSPSHPSQIIIREQTAGAVVEHAEIDGVLNMAPNDQKTEGRAAG